MREPRRSTPHGETPYSPSSLLRALTANPYDVDALRRHEPTPAEDTPPDNRITRTVTVLLALVLGFTVAVAVTELRRDAAAEDNPRALLEQEVLDARAEIEELEARQETLDGEIADAQAVVLDGADANDAEHLQAEEGLSAASSLEGTGVVLSLQDSVPLPASPGVAEGTVNRVTDGDLQIAVNALWAAGAEAISINGQRLSATSAIRTAGSAVLVDFRPLSPPYEVTALGDPQAVPPAPCPSPRRREMLAGSTPLTLMTLRMDSKTFSSHCAGSASVNPGRGLCSADDRAACATMPPAGRTAPSSCRWCRCRCR